MPTTSIERVARDLGAGHHIDEDEIVRQDVRETLAVSFGDGREELVFRGERVKRVCHGATLPVGKRIGVTFLSGAGALFAAFSRLRRDDDQVVRSWSLGDRHIAPATC